MKLLFAGFCPISVGKIIALEIPGGKVELALDEGILMGRGKELPFAEVEVELKEGTDEAAVAFAKALAEEFGLVPEEKSKFARARALAMT